MNFSSAASTLQRPLVKSILRVLRFLHAYSLDAVIVAVFWSVIFADGFMGRIPSAAGLMIMASTVWLIYAADRLLDAAQIDTLRPHSLRHRVHLEQRIPLSLMWAAILIFDIAMIVTCLSLTQIRLGLVGAGAILVYGAGVHFRPPGSSRRRALVIPKEVQIGFIFAYGIGLFCWADAPSPELLVASILAACNFAANCISVAKWESDLDGEQGIASFAVSSPDQIRRLPGLLVCLAIAAGMLGISGRLPSIVAGSLFFSSCSLLAVHAANSGRANLGSDSQPRLSEPTIRWRSIAADAVLVVAPTCWWLVH